MKTLHDEYTQVLDEIRSTSKKFNKASDAATEQIESVEKRLLEVEPGVTVWGPRLLSEDIQHVDEDTGASCPAHRVVTLGFGRSKKKWGFVVRQEVVGQAEGAAGGQGLTLVDEVRSLRKADRDLRIMALPHLLQVVQAVRDELNRRVTQLWPREGDGQEGENLELAQGSVSAAAPL